MNCIRKKASAKRRFAAWLKFFVLLFLSMDSFQTAHFIQFFDAGGFVFDILVDIIREQSRCGLFYAAVLLYRLGIAPEEIAKCDMTVKFTGMLGAYV